MLYTNNEFRKARVMFDRFYDTGRCVHVSDQKGRSQMGGLEVQYDGWFGHEFALTPLNNVGIKIRGIVVEIPAEHIDELIAALVEAKRQSGVFQQPSCHFVKVKKM